MLISSSKVFQAGICFNPDEFEESTIKKRIYVHKNMSDTYVILDGKPVIILV